ncbi:MAG: 50S ribosomal protein L10 [Dethiobacter sp.]|nr:MAG: 50S ribosomal protein L10 [Dethiobacter sp.]
MGNREVKEEKVLEIKEDLNNSKVVVLTDYRGLTVAQISKLRRILSEEGVKYKVVKNTLTILAARKAGLDDLEQYLQGPTAVAFGYDDPVTPIKLLVKFAKENDQLSIKGGVLEKNVLNEIELRRLSELPPKDVLLSMTLRGFQAPLVGMLNVLQGNIRNLVYVLDAIKEQKESA